MLSERNTALPIRKRQRSAMALHVNSLGRVDVQVKMIRVEHDRQSLPISGLRTSLRQARYILRSRDNLVEDVLERPRTTRSPRRQDASAVPKGNGGHTKAISVLFSRKITPNRAGGRCDLPTPTPSPVSRPCSLTEEMPSSFESGAGPSIRGGALAMGTKRRVGFDIEESS